jgi:Na+/phosphate symporter
VTSKFYHRIKYRAGIYQFTLPNQTNNEQVTDFGTTFGFGIPIVVQNSLSSINLGVTIGKRGIADSQAFREQYYGINLGFSIAPGTDKWFVKRKLN